jgi:hypothetical protein
MEHIAKLEEELLMYSDFDEEDLYVQAYPRPEVRSPSSLLRSGKY